MTTLHIINAPQTEAQLSATLSLTTAHDSLVFIQDSCYCLNAPSIVKLLTGSAITVYAIKEDLIARNVIADKTLAVEAIDYELFVDLTLSHKKTITW
jgi:tRNA 2-thiouridine synthesizing protein B